MTLLVGTGDLTQRQATNLLFSYDIDGLPARLGHTLRRLRELGYLDSVMAAITDIAQGIDSHGSPIDHARRRALFSEADIDLDFCYRFCDQTGRTRPKENKQRHLRLRMIELLTGTHPRYLQPPSRLDVSLQGPYGRLVLQLPEPYAVHLQEQAQRHLDAAGIHEPLQWEPPASWMTGNELPGPEISSLPHEPLWERIRNGSPARTLAREYGTSIEHVRVFVDLHPVPDTSSRPHRSKFPSSDLPSADQIRRSYASGARLREISETFGYSRGVIRRLCKMEGVSVNHPGRQYSRDIDPSWFRHEYLVKQRSISDIADEMKVSPNTIHRQAVAFGIPSGQGPKRSICSLLTEIKVTIHRGCGKHSLVATAGSESKDLSRSLATAASLRRLGNSGLLMPFLASSSAIWRRRLNSNSSTETAKGAERPL